MIGNRIVFFTAVVLLAGAALVTGNDFGGPLPNHSGVNGVTCRTSGCHFDFDLNFPGGSVDIGGLPAEWSPGVTYPLEVTVQRGGASRFGFQMTSVDSTVAQAGTFTAGSGTAVQTAFAGANMLDHMQHSFAQPGGGTATFNFDWTAPATSATGAVRFNVAGNAADGNFNRLGDFIYSSEVTVLPATADPQETIGYFPQVIDGAFGSVFYTTTLFVSNPASSGSANVTITFTNSSGGDFEIPFLDSEGQSVGSGNVVTIVGLEGGQTKKLTSTAASDLTAGFATVTSDANVEATAIFSLYVGAIEEVTLLSEAAVTLAQASTDQSIFVDESSGFRTALAYVNPSSSITANLTFSLHDTNTGGTALLTKVVSDVSPLTQAPLFIDELFSTGGVTDPLADGVVGTLRIVSDTPVAVVSLRFLGDLFTTVPPFSNGDDD